MNSNNHHIMTGDHQHTTLDLENNTNNSSQEMENLTDKSDHEHVSLFADFNIFF